MIEARFPSVTIEDYVIMPDHIHAVIFLHEKAGGASPSPTLNDVICAFKSLTSRSCKQQFGIKKMFQRSSADLCYNELNEKPPSEREGTALAVEGACVTLGLYQSHCNALSLSRLWRQLPPGGSLIFCPAHSYK